MSDPKTLKYPNKSHRKFVTLPKPSPGLAEFFGIMIGDGGINNAWQANITLNATKDRAYSRYVHDLIGKLFSVTPTMFKRKSSDALRILLNSVTVVDFLVTQGLQRGDKLRQGLKIPNWILARKAYKAACVRGLIDTDGCIFVHTHTVAGKKYQNVGLTFSSRSLELIFQVAAIFEEFGIVPHISGRGQDIYLYRADAVEKYLTLFGSSNERISSIYKKWRGDRAV